MNTKTMTLNLPEREMDYLNEIAKEKGISKTQVVRQALRLYQHIDCKIKDGEQIFVNNHLLDKTTKLIIV